MSNFVPLSSQEKNQLHDAVTGRNYTPPPAFADTSRFNPHLRVFVAAFDGTYNDRLDIPKGERPTAVADFEKNLPNSKVLASQYYEGVGTRTSPAMQIIEGATGHGSLERATRAYHDLQKQVDAWRKEDPNIEVHVHVMSFSRGGGSALHFLNMVDDRGVPPPPGSPFRKDALPDNLGPHNVTSSAVLLDTVVTGQTKVLQLGLPASTKSVLEITASDESRRAFALTSVHDPLTGNDLSQSRGIPVIGEKSWTVSGGGATPLMFRETPKEFARMDVDELGQRLYSFHRVTSLAIPGVHSDIGGSYREGGIGEVSRFLNARFAHDLGLPIEAVRPTNAAMAASFGHDSRWEVDKVVDSFYGKHKREVFLEKDEGWKGEVAEQVLLTYPGGGTASSYVVAQPAVNYLKDPLFSEKHAVVVGVDAKGDITVKGGDTQHFSFNKKTDGLEFLGQPLGLAGSGAELRHAVSSTPGTPGTLSLEITLAKHYPMVERQANLQQNAVKAASDVMARMLAAPQEWAGAMTMHQKGASCTTASAYATPEKALIGLFKEGLPLAGQDPVKLTAKEAETITQALQTAKSGTLLAVGQHDIQLIAKSERGAHPGATILDVDNLRTAINLAPAHEMSNEKAAQSAQTPRAQTSFHAMEH